MDHLLEKIAECITSNKFSSKNKVFCLQLLKQSLRLNITEYNLRFFRMKSLITSLYNIALRGSERNDPLRRKLFDFSESNLELISQRMGTQIPVLHSTDQALPLRGEEVQRDPKRRQNMDPSNLP